MKVKDVNIGLMIASRINQLRMTKSAFGRKIGIPQSNVNRILERADINTEKLIQISEVLDYNFFELYTTTQVDEHYEASGPHGIVAKNIEKIDNREMVEVKEKTDEETQIILEDISEEVKIPSDCPDSVKQIIERLTMEVNLLKDHLSTTKNQLADKERLITHLLNTK